ncbi:MAG: hypothetical protein JSU94_10395 [Phycisphaerales bacterium]|nr:MAG: hypothetical protein JSU94_10395 [Phycisphaerales bacterium]
MRWLAEEIEGGRGHEVLLKAAAGFVEDVEGTRKALVEAGLDEGLLEKVKERLKGKG